MSARRFFVEGMHTEGDAVQIGPSDAHKIAHVLRLQSGDVIEIVDSAAVLFDAKLTVDAHGTRAVLFAGRTSGRELRVEIDVAQGIPKGQKMDFVVEKLTELGAHAILPFESERSVAHDVGSAKLERWRRLAKSAALQSGRTVVPEVIDPQTLDDILARCASYDVALFPWEVAAQNPLRAMLPALIAGATRILIVIGPEGGFSHAEAERAAAAGAHRISLGARILRTETAALALLAILAYECAK
ncbi:MAG: 16S rRNA (uracil(1498)-N(3))-methyltransferase [Candidatus Eremiobacteraeota bacterium]|nr:16S rRNA (uracil(1498)-N(3))-methyltransferase [Candidatus Eremiobacteraeota bacterium]